MYELIRRTDLAPSARLLAALIAHHAAQSSDGWAAVTVAVLGRELGLQRRQTAGLLAELEAAGLLAVDRHQGRPSRYRLTNQTTLSA